MVSVASTLSAVSDDKATLLFKAVALSSNDCSEILITKLKITRKQFYLNIEKLIHVDLVKRIGGKYSLTSLGKITSSMLTTIETAIKYYWKLKAIDSIFMSENG
jgi:predicted transcriptional regulator